MTFIVTYRDKSGTKREEALGAVNRAACMADCHRRGISPLAIREGGKGVKGLKNDNSPKGNSHGRRVLAILGFMAVLAILGGGTWLWLQLSKTEPLPPETTEKPKALPKEVKPVKPAKSTMSPTAKPTAKPIKSIVKQTSAMDKPKKALTPEDEGYVSEDPTFAERYKRFKEEQAKLPFKHQSELEIYRIISTMPGETILPAAIHPNFEEDLVEHLDDPIVINDDDSVETKQDKETMIAVKAKLKQLMAEGQSPRKILEAEQDHLVKVMNLRDNLFAELRTVEGSAKSLQEVEDYVKAANKMLEEYGAKNIKLPMSPARLRLLKLELEKETKKNNEKESK